MPAAESLLDAYLPEYDVSDTVACTVDADPATTWRALLAADLIEVGRSKPLVAALGFSRLLPEVIARVLRGEGIERGPRSLRLVETTELPASAGGWVLLGERSEDELALGLVGKFWRPVIEYAQLEASEFRDFDEPGWAKTVYDLRVRPVGDRRTLLTATMRTATTDEAARHWFRRYWTVGIGSGAQVLVNGLLESVRDHAELEAANARAAADAATPR